MTVVPLGDVFCEYDFVVIETESRAAEGMLECLLRTFAGTNLYAIDTGRIDQFTRANELGSSACDLFDAVQGEIKLGCSCEAAMLTPDRFPWILIR
jgi:hypothetical protein